MKTIGLLGGMSWESTVPYYRIINQEISRRLGGLHSAKLVLYSVDFEEVERMQHADRWDQASDLLVELSKRLQLAGADFLVLCTNTMHKLAPDIEQAVDIPLLHIADATADAIRGEGVGVVGLLGTRFTMEQDFYAGRLRERHGLEVLTPGESDREVVHKVIYTELCHGRVVDASRKAFVEIVNRMVDRGAEGIILGCTEIPMLLRAEDVPVPLFDTTTIHARAAAELASRAC